MVHFWKDFFISGMDYHTKKSFWYVIQDLIRI